MSQPNSIYHKTLAEYFCGRSLYLDEPINKNPNIRKLIEQPWQQTEAAIYEANIDLWDYAIETLCDLRFIGAKCEGKVTSSLIDDYNNALSNQPENLVQMKQDLQQREILDRWTREIIGYSKECNEWRNNSFINNNIMKSEPQLPKIPVSCRIWTQEEINSEYRRIREYPTRFDKLKAFFDFVQRKLQSLRELSEFLDYAIQCAFNYEPEGIIHRTAAFLLSKEKNLKVLREWYENNEINTHPALIKTLEGPNSWITCVDMTPNGQFVVTGCNDSSIQVWDTMYGKCIKEMNPKAYPVTHIRITPDCRLAIVSTHDGKLNGILQLWDLDSGKCLQIFEGHTLKISSVDITPDGSVAVSSGSDKTLRVWDLKNGNCLQVLEDHNEEVSCVCITPDGKKAISANGPFIKIWEITQGKLIKSFEGGNRRYFNTNSIVKFNKIKITPDGKTVVASNESFPRCMVCDLETGTCLKEVGIEGGGEISITLDAKYAMFAGPSIMDLSSGKIVETFVGHTQRVTGVCISPDNKFGVSVSNDKTIKIWNIEKGNVFSDKKIKPQHSIRKVVISSDDSKIYSQTDFDIFVWDLDSGQFLKNLKLGRDVGKGSSIDKFYVSPDNKHFIKTCKFADHSIYICDSTGDVLLHELKGHQAEISYIRIVSDKNLVISASQNDHSIRVWNISSGLCQWVEEGLDLRAEYFNLSTDNKFIFSLSKGKTLNIIDIQSGVTIGSFEIEQKNLVFYDFGEIKLSKNPGIRLNLVRVDGAYLIRDLNNSNCICTLGPIKLTSDRVFAFISNVHLLKMWDLTTGNCINIFDNPGKRNIFTGIGINPNFYDFIITPDNQYIISLNNDYSVRVWETKSSKCIGAEHINSSSSLAYSAAKKKIIIGTWMEELQIFSLSGVNFKQN
jgi:WD40 repeat protein